MKRSEVSITVTIWMLQEASLPDTPKIDISLYILNVTEHSLISYVDEILGHHKYEF
jgi:hypothetical protein